MDADSKVRNAIARAQRAVDTYQRRAGAALAYHERQHVLFGERPYVSTAPLRHARDDARTEARIVAQYWADACGSAQAHIDALEQRGLATSEAYGAALVTLAQCQTEWRRWIRLRL